VNKVNPLPHPANNAVSRRRSAFTLVELLIVIVIIAVLAAILFPLMTNARERSRKTACLSNQRQISTAWLMYSQDFDQRVVPWSVSGKSASDAFIWDRLIQPYQKNEDLLRCPSTSALVSYSYSAGVGGASPSPPLRTLASLKNPTLTPIIADCAGFTDSNNVRGWSFSFIIPDEKGGIQSRAIKYGTIEKGRPTGESRWFAPPTADRTAAASIKADRHGNGSNYIFADGHAKWMAFQEDSMGRPVPPRKGLDYNSDGILGDDAAAGTAGKYD
jgi:prepilin-type N-terminal cleavage/methylation domain-containing protein/prepilin-type processing-associated H-X9-DG protein